MCEDMDLTLLGQLPLDPRIGQSCDEGRSFLDSASPATTAFVAVAEQIRAKLENQTEDEMDTEANSSVR